MNGSTSERTERFRCPDCGRVVVANVRASDPRWSLGIECAECSEAMDAGIHAYGGEQEGER